MEANRKRTIRSGAEYDYLFARATLKDVTVKKGATVADTVRFIPKVVSMKRWQTKAYTDKELRGLSTYEACKKLWHFLYNHVAYKKDEEGLEQIRSPARAWHDRFTGVDCDCYTTFISTVLTNLGIHHTLRIAKYAQDYFQHIYPVVPMPDGSHITIDCVVNEFNYEEPYTEIKDTKMDLQLLDGIDEKEPISGTEEEIFGIEEDQFGQLGWSLKKAVKKVGKAVSKGASFVGKKVVAPVAKTVAKAAVKAGKFTADKVKKGVHLINRINPATLLLRNGVLASMKLNVFNVAHNLRLSYLSPAEVQKRNINPSKFKSIVNIRKKLESILYAAGGKDAALKSAILKGKGNSGKDKVLAGLEGVEDTDFGALDGMDDSTPLYQLLGPEIFNSSNVITEEDLHGLREMELDGFEGLEGINGTGLADGFYVGQELTGLGEPATLSLAAASGALATIAGLIKNIGNIYQKGKAVADKIKPITQVAKSLMPSAKSNPAAAVSLPQTSPGTEAPASADQPEESPQEPEAPIPNSSGSSSTAESTSSAETESGDPVEDPEAELKITPPQSRAVVTSNSFLPATVEQASTAATTASPAESGFWDKHKKWLKPTLIGVTGVGIIYLGYKMFSGTKAKPPTAKPVEGLSGLKGKKKKKAAKGKKKQPIALM